MYIEKKGRIVKILAVILSLCMIMIAFTGCGENKKADSDKNVDKKIVLNDAVGRKVEMDGPAERVIATNGGLRLYCYVGSPDKLVGREEIEKKGFMGRPYAIANKDKIYDSDLPIIGPGGPHNVDNEEALIEANPDVIFVGRCDADRADKLQEKTGIPVVVVSYGNRAKNAESINSEDAYVSLKAIGKAIGEEKRAKEVIDFMKDCEKDLNDRTKDIPDEKKPTTYVGGLAHKGPHGIESTYAQYPLFKIVHANNVADATGKDEMMMIDKEQLLEWDPEIIFIDLASIGLIQENLKAEPGYYNNLQAFREGNVYSQLPYNWYMTNIDTVLVDAYYIGKVLYPDEFKDVDPEEKAKEIYETMVGKDVYPVMSEAYFGGLRKLTTDDILNLEIPEKK